MERLEKLRLTTLLEKRRRDDLIETFKIINGINKIYFLHDILASLFLEFLEYTPFKYTETNDIHFDLDTRLIE